MLYIDAEMARRLLKVRLADEVKRSGLQPEGFHAFSHEDVNNFHPLNTHPGQAMIERLIQEVGGVDFIIFDNIMSLILGDMKDEEGWRQSLQWQRSLTKRNIGQLWVHHTGHDESRSYGTKTREWQVDTVIALVRVTRLDTDVSFQLEFRKARERTPETRADFAVMNIALVDNEWIATPVADEDRATSPSPLGAQFLAALVDAINGPEAVIHNDNKCVTTKVWKRACVSRGLLSDVDIKQDSARSLFSKYRRELIACRLIGCKDELTWLILGAVP